MKKLIIANWKMNPGIEKDARRLLNALRARSSLFKKIELVICPPFVYVPLAVERARRIPALVGVQNISDADMGLHTGEISASMARSVGATHVILGHSERRAMGETDELIREKIIRALAGRLTPVVALGETERTEDAHHVLGQQLKKILFQLPREKVGRIIFAYEPRWAISGGVHDTRGSADTPESALEKMIYIRRLLANRYGAALASRARILYGGSVRAHNVRLFLAGNPSFNGAHVGGASVDQKAFTGLVEALC